MTRKTVEEIKVINIDDATYAVDSLSEGIQNLVEFYNIWNQEEADQRVALAKTAGAKEHISHQIVEAIRKETADSGGDSNAE